MLRISPKFKLPDEAVTQTFGIVAKRGVGKTYTAAVMVEEMVKAGLPVVVVDPLGVWFGLRSSADGTKPGLPVIILGGEHGDVPLEATGGSVVADLLVDSPAPLVIDLSLMRKGESRRFMTDFLEQLYRRNRDPLHVVLDEADEWAPQRPLKGAERLLGACEDLVRRGRARGLGVTLITQRPAVIHKDVLTQIEVLVALRVIGPQDRSAIDDWVKVHGTADQRAELMASLPNLPIGTAWFWSPGWLDVFQRVEVRTRETFDSSATPKAGQRAITPKAAADVDLEALKQAMHDSIERAQADDPKLLRKRIAELEKQLAGKPEQTVEVRVDVPVVPDVLFDRMLDIEGHLHESVDELDHLRDNVELLSADLDRVRAAIVEWHDAALDKDHPGRDVPGPPTARPARAPALTSEKVGGPRTIPAKRASNSSRTVNAASRGVEMPAGEVKVLSCLAQHAERGVTSTQLTLLTTYKRSTRDRYLQYLQAAGRVEKRNGRVFITEQGLADLGDAYNPLPAGDELRAHYLSTLPEGEAKILRVVAAAWPEGLTPDEISETADYKRSTRDRYLQYLQARELVFKEGGRVYAKEELFG